MSEWSAELRRLAVLAAPMVAIQVGTMLMGVVDTIMVGGIGSDAIAAAALGNVWVMGTLVIGLGVTLGIDPLLTQAHGAGDGEAVGVVLQRGLVVAAIASVPIAILWFWTEDALVLAGQSPHLARLAHSYVIVQWPSALGFLGFTVLRSYLQGRSLVAPALWVTLFANLGNVALNWVLIFGKLGVPALGPAGPRRIFVLGLPVGVQLGLEMWAFQAATLLAGWLGKEPLAAHTVVISLASMSFMVPLGISMAAVTRIGNLLGAGDPKAAQRAAWVALGMGAAVMCVSALGFVTLRSLLPRGYTSDPVVLVMAASLMPIAGAFQLFDGIQVVGGGILRGMGRTRPAALFNLLGYYLLGLPVAYYLAFETGMGVAGIWWGLTLGLMIVAVLLAAWISVRGPGRMPVRPVELE